MPNIDIQVDADLQEMFDLPSCADISLPPPRPIKINLPGGGTLSSFSDLSKGVPTDCAMTFSLLMQIGPFLASTECLIKVLKLVMTVVDVLKSVTNPISLVSAIPKIIKAAEPVIECAVSFTPVGLIPFIRDLLCLIRKVLNCFLGQMKSVLRIMEMTALQITIAEANGNDELLQSLNCAQENANTQAQHMTKSLDAVAVILELAGDLMQIVGVKPIKLPTLGSQADLAALHKFVEAIQTVVATLTIVTDALGGCDQ
ncbi:MAG TPA: hypothetical protein VHR66_25720 [Gemmataceae bacterium]|jgi:hypothetical protein|nr:hypothetical protein [Gemmataceae bacterium]